MQHQNFFIMFTDTRLTVLKKEKTAQQEHCLESAVLNRGMSVTRSHPGAEYKLDLHDCISTIRTKMNEIHQKVFIIY